MRESTWAQIGTDVKKQTTVDAVLKKAGLDYDVELRPVFMDGGIQIPNAKVAVRTTDDHPYGIVSDKYEVVQNREAFDFVNYLSDELAFEKAGETNKGMVYIIGRLPDKTILGDTFTPHVIFRNSFAGNYTIAAAICPLRFVCQNQFNFAFKNTANTVNVRHMRSAEARLIEARETLKVSYQYMDELQIMAEGYAQRKVATAKVQSVVETLFPMEEDASARKETNVNEARAAFMSAYMSDDNANFKGTAWGLVNAYTDFLTHKEVQGNEPTQKRLEARFVRTTMRRPMNRILAAVDAVS